MGGVRLWQFGRRTDESAYIALDLAKHALDGTHSIRQAVLYLALPDDHDSPACRGKLFFFVPVPSNVRSELVFPELSPA